MSEPAMAGFPSAGEENTAHVIRLVVRRLEQGGIEHVVVATTTGATAVRFAKALAKGGTRLVAVTHQVGFREGDVSELLPKHEKALRAADVPIVTASHALSGVGRSISGKLGGVTPVEMIAHTLRLFGQGMKVTVEIAVMAADAGAIPTDRDVLAVGGTGRGADTAVVLRAAHANRFFDLQLREVLCKPSSW